MNTSPNCKIALLVFCLFTCYNGMSQSTRGLKTIKASSTNKINYGFNKQYAIIIGINNYRSENIPDLEFAKNDAQSIKDMMMESQQFTEDNIVSLFNEDATKNKILSAFDYLQNICTEDDKVFVFYAGHGKTRKILGGVEKGYILPYDANLDELTTTAISTDQLNEFSGSLLAKHLFFAMDACYGGNIVSRSVKESSSSAVLLDVLSNRIARQAMTAGGADQEVLDGGPEGHSVFTYHLLSAIEHKLADYNKDKVITTSELASYLIPAVSVESNKAQTPQYGPMKGNRGGEYFFLGPDRFSKLQINSNVENAKVYVDGEFMGVTPLNVSLDKGKHKVSLNNNDIIIKDTTVLVELDMKLYMDLTLLKKKEFKSELERELYIKGVKNKIIAYKQKGQIDHLAKSYKNLYRLTGNRAILDSIIITENKRQFKLYKSAQAARKNSTLDEFYRVIKQLEQEYPNNLEVALLRLDEVSQNKKKQKRTSQLLKKYPADPILLEKIVEIDLGNNSKSLIKNINELLSVDVDNVMGHFFRGVYYKNQNSFEEALRNFNKVNELSDTLMVDNYLQIADVYYQKNKYKKSIDAIMEAFSFGAKTPELYYYLGLNEIKIGDLEKAKSHFKSALGGNLDLKYRGYLSIRSFAQIDSASYHISRNDYHNALNNLTKSLTYNSLNYTALVMRAQVYNKMFMNLKAFQDLDRAIELSPKKLDAFVIRRDYNLAMGNYEHVLRDAGYILTFNKDDARSLSTQGIAHFHLENYEQTVINLKKSISLNKKVDSVYYYLAKTLFKLNKNIDAMKYIKIGLKLNKAYPKLWYLQGEVLHRLKEYKTAVESFHKSDKFSPNKKTTLMMIAICYQSLQDYKQAISYFQKAKYIDAMDPALLTHLANCYNRIGDPREALANYEMAYMSDTTVANSLKFCLDVAYLYLDKQNYRSAFTYLSRLEKLNFESWKMKYTYAEFYAYQGNINSALKYLEEALIGANVSLYKRSKKSKYFAPIRRERDFKKLLKLYK